MTDHSLQAREILARHYREAGFGLLADDYAKGREDDDPSILAVLEALSHKRSEDDVERRICKVCTAVVATFPEAMCCHCQEVPWAIAALDS